MKNIGLFEAYGVEIEHMIVDERTLAVRPYADRLLVEDGEIVNEIEDGEIAWSNELAQHVIELKTNGPAPALTDLPERFAASTRRMRERLAPHGAVLLPGAMHPLMEPATEFVRWPHDDEEIYRAFDTVFDCRGHGWSNLQSVHLNLPFSGDEEFGRLHAAIRIVLPLLPALAAASPVYDGRRQPFIDARLHVYRGNAAKVPFVSGRVIPEPAFDRASYDEMILEPLYGAIRPHDPDGILQHEWLNARGAIARFDRNTIEIRVIDAQETNAADVAICAAAAEVVRWLTTGDSERQRGVDVDRLVRILDRTIRRGDRAVIDDADLLDLLGFPGSSTRADDLWCYLVETTRVLDTPAFAGPLTAILRDGPLGRRLSHSVGHDPSRERILEVYGELVRCLATERSFAS